MGLSPSEHEFQRSLQDERLEHFERTDFARLGATGHKASQTAGALVIDLNQHITP